MHLWRALITFCGSSIIVACGGAGSVPRLTPIASAASSPPTATWRITVYYTAVETYYSGPAQNVVGCRVLNCGSGKDALGSFPSDFVQEVKKEGTGKIAAGSYLNWSIDTGYWLDSAPRDARGGVLIPFQSAAADPRIAFGTAFHVLSCGGDTVAGTPVSAQVCARYQAPTWVVSDRFTEGAVGNHVDLYIGEQDSAGFTGRDAYIDASHATLQF